MPVSVPNQDPNARAATAAQLKYGASQDAVNRAIAALAGTRAADEASINQYGTGGRQAINQTFDQLLQNLTTNRQLTQSGLATQVDQVGQGYREANQIADAARQQAIDRLGKMYGNNNAYAAVQLGDVASPIERLAAQVIGENAQSDATATGNLRTWAAQQDAFARMAESGAERDRSNRLSGFESELLRALSGAKYQATEKEFDLQGNLLDLISERGSYQNDKASEYADQLFGQMIQAGQLNLAEAEAASAAAARSSANSLDREKFEWSKSQAGQEQDNEDYWRALEFDLKSRGLSNEEARDMRDYLYQENQNAMDRKWQTAQYLSAASNAAIEGGGDATSATDAAMAQLRALGILPKERVQVKTPGMSAGIQGSTSTAKPKSNSRPGFFSGILG